MRGKCYLEQREWSAAIRDYQIVLEMQPDNREDRLDLIKALVANDKYEEAGKGIFPVPIRCFRSYGLQND